MRIIIPTLDEEAHLGALLADLSLQVGLDLEVVVADGGSSDRTLEIARRWQATIVASETGRARQMNAGVKEGPAWEQDWLLFLHADTRLSRPDLLCQALAALSKELEQAGHRVAGHFALRFPAVECQGCFRYRYLERKTTTNRKYTIHGDQGLLIHRRFFEELGGFDESLPFLEDQAMARAIDKQGSWHLLPGQLQTSTRRFESEGFGNSYLKMAVMMGAFTAECDRFFEVYDELYESTVYEARDARTVLTAVVETTRQMGPEECLLRWGKVAQFIVENAWQLPFAVDVALEPVLGDDAPLLRLFDQLF